MIMMNKRVNAIGIDLNSRLLCYNNFGVIQYEKINKILLLFIDCSFGMLHNNTCAGQFV